MELPRVKSPMAPSRRTGIAPERGEDRGVSVSTERSGPSSRTARSASTASAPGTAATRNTRRSSPGQSSNIPLASSGPMAAPA